MTSEFVGQSTRKHRKEATHPTWRRRLSSIQATRGRKESNGFIREFRKLEALIGESPTSSKAEVE